MIRWRSSDYDVRLAHNKQLFDLFHLIRQGFENSGDKEKQNSNLQFGPGQEIVDDPGQLGSYLR